MPFSYNTFTGDGVTDTFVITFPYLDTDHVSVDFDDVPTSFTFLTTNTVQTDSVPGAGVIVKVSRNTPSDVRLVDFTNGAILNEEDLDKDSDQVLYILQEFLEVQSDAISAVQAQASQAAAEAAQTAAEAAQTAAEAAQTAIEAISTIKTDTTANLTVGYTTDIFDYSTTAAITLDFTGEILATWTPSASATINEDAVNGLQIILCTPSANISLSGGPNVVFDANFAGSLTSGTEYVITAAKFGSTETKVIVSEMGV